MKLLFKQRFLSWFDSYNIYRLPEGVDPDAPTAVFEEITQRVPLGGNLRASEAYRRNVAPVLLQRAARACV